MPLLNQQTYEQLLSAKPPGENSGTAQWYAITYQLFRLSPLDSMDDFFRLIAYAYSWMPTIPKIRPERIDNTKVLLSQLRQLKDGDADQVQPLLQQLIPIINNSLTGVSKLLHFIAPEQVPIIDRNVLSGWEVLFFILHPQEGIVKLPHYKTALNHRHLLKYLQYREVLIEWVANCEESVTMRDLEFGLFELGKQVTPDHFKVYHPEL